MTTTYILRSTDSDLGGGADFSKALLETTATQVLQVVSVANQSTEDSFGFTDVGDPGSSGVTGTYTVELNVQVGDTSIFCSVAVARVNSSGTVQSGGTAFTSEQTCTAGVKTFNVPSTDLGTWNVGDRLRVTYRFRSSNQHGGDHQIEIGFNTTGIEVVAPWTEAVTPSGGSEAAVAITSEGSGTGQRIGSAEAAVSVTSEGSGSSQRSGSAESSVSVTAEGLGTKHTVSGSSETNVLVTAEGQGQAVIAGGSEASVAVSAEGSGSASRSGFSESSVNVTSEGQGSKQSFAGSESSVVITAEGGGQVGGGDPTGGSESSVAVSSEASGLANHIGASEAEVVAVAESLGTKIGSGGSTSSVSVTAEGAGTTGGPSGPSGGSEVGVLVQAEGDGTANRTGSSESLVEISATGQGSALLKSGGSTATVNADPEGHGSNKSVRYKIFRSGGVLVAIRMK